MSKGWKLAGKIILWLIAGILLAVILFFAVLTVMEFKPEDEEILTIDEGTDEEEKGRSLSASAEQSVPAAGDTVTVMTWNTGYAGLGEESDFFMDGGENVASADRETVEENIEAIRQQIGETDADVVFLQEVDLNSKRSYYINEYQTYLAGLDYPYGSFAENYKCLYVPYPLPTIGKVDSGIATLSRYELTESTRIALPCPFSYPVRMCNLKRCLMVSRIAVAGSEKELVLVNLHLEAYDDGEGKKAQTEALKNVLEEETKKGNYVIAGGDFNQSFSNYDNSAYACIDEDYWVPGEIDISSFSDSLTFLTDNRVPTCRSLDRPLAGNDPDPDRFQYYVIDGFIVSDNLTVQSVETKDLSFVNSDHNPIVLTLQLEE